MMKEIIYLVITKMLALPRLISETPCINGLIKKNLHLKLFNLFYLYLNFLPDE